MNLLSKRCISLSVCVTMLMGLLTALPGTEHKVVTANATSTNLLETYNASYEEGSTGYDMPVDWRAYSGAGNTADITYFETVDVTATGNPTGTPTTATDGTHVLKFTQPSTATSVRGLVSTRVDVSQFDAVWAGMDIYGSSDVQMYIMFYNAQNQCPSYNANDPATHGWRCLVKGSSPNGWTQLCLEAAVPDGAVTAEVMIYKSYTNNFPGTIYVDRVILTETELTDTSYAYPEVPTEINYNWTIVESGHPRVYFDAEELLEIKAFAADTNMTTMGYSGNAAYNQLITQANDYLAETEFSYTWAETTLTFPLYPVLADMSIRPEFELAPAPNYAIPYPYMTQATWRIQDRVEALSLAYVLSGNEAYGERAVQYATDMCNWQYWVGKFETIDNSTERSAQPMGYCVTAVATAYDLCFDLLTAEEKALIENALIQKGLEPMYETCGTRMARGRDHDHMSTTFLACAAIMNESNISALSKYLDRAMQYNQWIFDWYDMGHNEGYSYAECGIDPLVEAMGVIERVTGITGNLNHHFFTDTFPAWVKGFVETSRGTMPGYSDSPYDDFYTIALSVMAKRGDTAAAYCISLANGADSPFQKLIYTHSLDGIAEKPKDNYMNVTVVEEMGVGALRTGWGQLDKLLVLVSDDYGVNHAHYESNSLFMATNGTWIIRDPGYGSIQPGVNKTYYDTQYASNTIFVDNTAQTVKGAGSVSKILDSELYGHILGQAPGAYGKKDGRNVLSKFDRHTVMMNHNSNPYYIVFDDLAAGQNHVYGWNMYHSSWDGLMLDGETFNMEGVTAGNHLAMRKGNMVLHTEFVGEELNFSAPYYTRGGEQFGPLIRVNSDLTAQHQFMTVLSVDTDYVPGADYSQGTVYVTEAYDTASVLGATIRYGTVLSDVVLFNRGNATVSGGTLVTNASQAAAMGVHSGNITEGYSMVNGTTMSFGNQTLISANGTMSMAVDYTYAKVPVSNKANGDLCLHEEFDITTPTTLVQTSAAEARTVTFHLGNDAPYTVYLDEVLTEGVFSNGSITLSIPAGEHEIRIIGTHTCSFDWEVVGQSHVVTESTCTEPGVYYVSCFCGANGTQTFQPETGKGHSLVQIPGKASTYTEPGNITYWICSDCELLFADAAGTVQISNINSVYLPLLSVPGQGNPNHVEEYNFSFEDGVTGGIPVGWTEYTNSKSYYSVTNEASRVGYHSLKLLMNNQMTSPKGIYSSYIDISGMTELIASINCKTTISAGMQVFFYDSNKTQLSGAWTAAAVTGDWVTISRQFTVPSGAKYVRIMPYISHLAIGAAYDETANNYTEVAVYYDNAVIMDVVPIYDPLNYTFTGDTGTSTMTTAGWTGLANKDITIVQDPTNQSSVLRLDTTEATTTVNFYAPYVDIKGKDKISVSVDFKATTATAYYVYFYKSDKTAHSTPVAWGNTNVIYQPGYAPGVWTTVTKEIDVPEDAVFARVMLSKPKGGEVAYYDNITVTQVTES